MQDYNIKLNFLSDGAKQDVEKLSSSIKKTVEETKKSLESQGVSGKELYSVLSKQLDTLNKQAKAYSETRMAIVKLKDATDDWNNSIARSTTVDWANKIEARVKALNAVIKSTKADLEMTLVTESGISGAGVSAAEKAERARERVENKIERDEKRRQRLEEKADKDEEKRKEDSRIGVLSTAKAIWGGIDKALTFAGNAAQTVVNTRNATYAIGDALQFVPWFGGALSSFANKSMGEYTQLEQSGMKLAGIGGGRYFESWNRYPTELDPNKYLGEDYYQVKMPNGIGNVTYNKKRGVRGGVVRGAGGQIPVMDASDLSKKFDENEIYEKNGKIYTNISTTEGVQLPIKNGKWVGFEKTGSRGFEVEKKNNAQEILGDIKEGGLGGVLATGKSAAMIAGEVFSSVLDAAEAGIKSGSISNLGVKNADLFERAYILGRGSGRFGVYGREGGDGFVNMAKESYMLERAWQITPQTMTMMAAVSQMTGQRMLTQTAEIARVIRLTDPSFTVSGGRGYFDKYAEIASKIVQTEMGSLLLPGTVNARGAASGIGLARAMGYENPDQIQNFIAASASMFGGGAQGSPQKALQYYALSKAGVKDYFQANMIMKRMEMGNFSSAPAEYFQNLIDTVGGPAQGNVDILANTISSMSGGKMIPEAARELIMRGKMTGSNLKDILSKIESGKGESTDKFFARTEREARLNTGMQTKQDSDWNEGMAAAGRVLTKDFTNLSFVIKDIIKAWGKSSTKNPQGVK